MKRLINQNVIDVIINYYGELDFYSFLKDGNQIKSLPTYSIINPIPNTKLDKLTSEGTKVITGETNAGDFNFDFNIDFLIQ